MEAGDEYGARQSMETLKAFNLCVLQLGRHDLYHLMCITFELPESGLMFFVCLYRGICAPAFNDSEAGLFSAFCEHLLQLWRFQIQDMIRFDTGNGATDFGVARMDGSLLYVGAGLCAAIQRELPGWNGSMLYLGFSATGAVLSGQALAQLIDVSDSAGILIFASCIAFLTRRVATVAGTCWGSACMSSVY